MKEEEEESRYRKLSPECKTLTGKDNSSRFRPETLKVTSDAQENFKTKKNVVPSMPYIPKEECSGKSTAVPDATTNK